MNQIKDFLRPIYLNPITYWFKWVYVHLFYKYKYATKHVNIKYLAKVYKVRFGKYNTIGENCRLENTTLGNYVYIAQNTEISYAKVGSFCSIGSNVKIGVGIHPTNYISTSPVFYSNSKQCGVTFSDDYIINEREYINIGNDVWIGANALILDGIKIGDGAVVAAGAVVVKDIPPFHIYGGVPAKKIKQRFSDEEIETIIKTKWWNLNEKKLEEISKLMINPEDFFQYIQKSDNKL